MPASSLRLVAVILMAATGLSTLLPWTTGGAGSVIGVRHDDAFLVIAASALGIVLARMRASPAWIAPGFAGFAQLRDIRLVSESDLGVGIGLWVGIVAAFAASVILIADFVLSVRAAKPVEEPVGS